MKNFFRSLRNDARYFAGVFFFWLIIFSLNRIVFAAINHTLISSPNTLLSAIAAGLKLDAATGAWFTLILCLSLILTRIFRHGSKAVQLTVSFCLILLYNLIATGEAAVYQEWKSKLNFKAFMILLHPGELLDVTTTTELLVFVFIWLSISFFSGWLFVKYLWKRLSRTSTNITLPLLLIPVLAVIARGGLQSIPIGIASAYHSADEVGNDLAVNPGWNAFFQVGNSWDVFSKGNPFQFMTPIAAQNAIDRLYLQSVTDNAASSRKILNKKKPNIILIILESWSADMVSRMVSGPDHFTPEFNKISANGVLFNSFYANGNRSQQGITSVLTGFPALGLVAAADDSGFVKKLPGIPRILTSIGYSSKFIYGGDISYGNIAAVISSAGFESIRANEENFPTQLRRGSMGVHDGEMVDIVLDECDQMTAPFFLSYFTLSSHAPYDYPGADQTKKDSSYREHIYGESVKYTDAAIGDFMKKARAHPWFNETLFIFVADHGHNSWRNLPSWHPDFRRVPLLFAGPTIKPEFRGTEVSTIGSQIDLPATILGQIGLPTERFVWSRDLFRQSQEGFAQYELNYGFGFINRDGVVVFNKSTDQLIYQTGNPKTTTERSENGKALTQCTMQSFIDGVTTNRHCGADRSLPSTK